MPCSRTISTTPTGTTLSTTTLRRRSVSGSVFCGSWRRQASRWWPLTCRSRPSAGWRSPATSFVLYRPTGSTDPVRAEPSAAPDRGRNAGPARAALAQQGGAPARRTRCRTSSSDRELEKHWHDARNRYPWRVGEHPSSAILATILLQRINGCTERHGAAWCCDHNDRSKRRICFCADSSRCTSSTVLSRGGWIRQHESRWRSFHDSFTGGTLWWWCARKQ